MERLFEKFQQKLARTNTSFVRSIMQTIHWDARMIAIKGARGVGKTTLLLQYIKLHLKEEINQVLYLSLDSIWFAEYKLVDLADQFVKRGGKYLFLDEVHQYPNWSQELKNIYDDYPELKIVFTGSSLLEILNARADLSRRAVQYSLQGLSFREYLNLTQGSHFNPILLDDLLKNHLSYSNELITQIKPLQHFDTYLKTGYYPYFKEEESLYYRRVEEVLNMVIEIELPLLRGVEPAFTRKLKQLLLVIAESAPFIPNISSLSQKIGITRSTLLSYLEYLSEARLTNNIYKDSKGVSRLQKPDKLFLENTNLMHLLAGNNADKGSLRETFFVNQLSNGHIVEFAEHGDFVVDNLLTFEIGGQRKNKKQIRHLESSYIAADDLEYGWGNKIPLWLFGFLY